MKHPFWFAACCVGLPLSQAIAVNYEQPRDEAYRPTTTFSAPSGAISTMPAGQPAASRHYNFRPLSQIGWPGARVFDPYARPPETGNWGQPQAGQWHGGGYSGYGYDYDQRYYGGGPDYGVPYGAGHHAYQQPYATPYGSGRFYGTPPGYGSSRDYTPAYGGYGAVNRGYPPPPPYGEKIPSEYGPDYPVDHTLPYSDFALPLPGGQRELPVYPSEQLELEYGLPWTPGAIEHGAETPAPGEPEVAPPPAPSPTPATVDYEQLSEKYGIPPAPGQAADTTHLPSAPDKRPESGPATVPPTPGFGPVPDRPATADAGDQEATGPAAASTPEAPPALVAPQPPEPTPTTGGPLAPHAMPSPAPAEFGPVPDRPAAAAAETAPES